MHQHELTTSPTATPLAAMTESLRDAYETRGCATADDLRREGFDEEIITRFGQDAIVAARSLRDRDTAADPVANGPDPVDRLVGARIRLARQAAGLSQETLAERLGITFQQVQKYENAKNRVSASKLFKIAQATAKNPGWFFDQAEDPKAATFATELASVDLGLARDVARLAPDQRAAVRNIVAAISGGPAALQDVVR